MVDKETDKDKDSSDLDSSEEESEAQAEESQNDAGEDASDSDGADGDEAEGPKEEVLKNLFADFRATKEMDKEALKEAVEEAELEEQDEVTGALEEVNIEVGEEAADSSDESSTDAEEQKNFEPPREVAKTMLETDISSVMEKAAQLEKETDSSENSGRRVAKTMLESESPDLEKIKAAAEAQARELEPLDEPGERKVAKTMLEADLPDLSQLEPLTESTEKEVEKEVEEDAGEGRKVAKTMIEMDLPNQLQEKVLEAAREIDEANKKLSQEIGNRPISRSLTDIKVSFSLESQEGQQVEEESPKESFVARTMLDHELILDKLSESMQRIEAKTRKEIEEKEKEFANQPIKERIPIDNYKTAKPCQWKWEDDGYDDQFRYCGMCKQLVYNFDGMDKPEAMALIFKRENRENAPLFRRKDGKFMTADCPEAMKKQRFLTLTAVTVGTIFTLLLLLGLLIPKEDPAPAVNPGDQEAKTEFTGTAAPAGSDAGSGQPIQDTSGEVFYDVNKPLDKQVPAQSSPQPSSQAPDYSNAPESSESGDFWKFPNGKPESFEEPPVGSESSQIYPKQPEPSQAPASSSGNSAAPAEQAAPAQPKGPASHPTVKTY